MTLLSTKLFLSPPAPGLVARPRLLTRLEGLLNHKLTLVSAQAGFGKTTLINQWIHSKQPPLPIAWLYLEEAENDPVRFWDYFIAALKTIHPAISDESLIFLHSSQPVPIESTLTLLINDLISINDDFVLVLDDYQFIHSDAVHKGITFLLDHLPPKMHLVITTRVDPPLSLSNYRGKGTLLEIRADELRFTPEEAASLLHKMESLRLSAEDIAVLNERADGWVVGLKMAGLAMVGQEDKRLFVSSFTGNQRYIMDYLVDEVLKRQSYDIYNFLLQTSILEKMSGPLCDAVTQSTGGQEMLFKLEKANLFLVPLDASRQWYRYHHLFRDLLRHRFQLESGDESVRSNHHRASLWYEAKGLLEDAIGHALSARDWERAMDLIGTPVVYLNRVGTLTMLNWLRQVPLELLRSIIPRYFNYIYALLFTGQLEAVEDCLKYLDTKSEGNNHLQARITVVRSIIANAKGDWLKVEDYARRALSLLPAHNTARQDTDYRWDYASSYYLLGTALFQRGQFAEAEPFLERSIKIFDEIGFGSRTLDPTAMLAVVIGSRGRTRDALKLLNEITNLYKGDPATLFAHSILGNFYYRLNDLKSAAFHYEQSIKLYQYLSIISVTMLETNYLCLAQVRMAMRDIEGSMQALEEADRLLPDNPEDKARNTAFHAAISLMQGDTASSSRWFSRFKQYETVPIMNMPEIAIFMFQIRKGKHALVEEDQTYYKQLSSQGFWNYAMIARIYQALASDEDYTEKAMEFLAEALALFKTQENIRTFVDFGAPMASLLRKAITQGIETDYAHKLLDIIEDEERWRQSNRIKTRISSHTTSLLSEREIEVLRLLADGLTNQQIADKLTISLNTVKTHVYRVFDKLEAKHRGEAIARAKELKLIQ